MRFLILTYFLLFTALRGIAQYPGYFLYDDENGVPSNEIYSLVQDKKGFIWFGCDAGLYKFDGVQYQPYKCPSQLSKAITGLTFSTSGKLYCYNFQSQLFVLENNVLKKLPIKLHRISRITADDQHRVHVQHELGLAIYSEKTKQWRHINQYGTATAGVFDGKQTVSLLTQKGVLHCKNTSLNLSPSSLFKQTGFYMMARFQGRHVILSAYQNLLLSEKNGKVKPWEVPALKKLLFNRKPTNIKVLTDGRLWICTYNGLIVYSPKNKTARLLYPDLSFSDCLIDREGNYWFSTLQTGLLRVPNLNYLLWNKTTENTDLKKITHLDTDGKHVYYSTGTGGVGYINCSTESLVSFSTGHQSDIQSFDYIAREGRLYFNINKHLYYLSNDQIKEAKNDISSLKMLYTFSDHTFILSSFGTYLPTDSDTTKLDASWSREITSGFTGNDVWIATNNGLMQYKKRGNKWMKQVHLCRGLQVLSVVKDPFENKIFALCFNGVIVEVDAQDKHAFLAKLPASVQGNKLLFYRKAIYVASNRGLWIFNLSTRKWSQISSLYGLASENILDLLVCDRSLWLATGKGVQRIPIVQYKKPVRCLIYLEESTKPISLDYDGSLRLHPAVSAYSSNGKHQYAYRLRKEDSQWTYLPGSTKEIFIQNVPDGRYNLELKAIDAYGYDSQNIIAIPLIVHPPFWQSWWFIVLVFLCGTIIVFLIVHYIINGIRKKEAQKTLLANSQLKAIRAQMNPHFMYNTLNSIQDLILHNDIKNSNYYLSKFSQLMRQILSFSEQEKILISEEVDMLTNYLELEKLRFGTDFMFQITCDEQIDQDRVYIPSLILQPFVENAIKHGLLHKKGNKDLFVAFHANSKDEILVEISDNGIGRVLSAAINERRKLTHQSFSTNAIKKRIEILNESGEFNIEVQISDGDNQADDCGTIVQLRIQYIGS